MIGVAVLGCGTVGTGAAEILTMNKDLLTKKVGQELELLYMLHRREVPEYEFADKVTLDFAKIEQDPRVQIVAECIGGVGAALDYVRRSLQAGKHVVTSNKELVAKHGWELLQIAKEKNVNFFFEGSVGGGIPVLRPLACDLAGNAISQVAGIINGTTNFILTKMFDEGAAFADVLKDAQEKGYAEADPTADVEGIDACRKACILSALSFGFHVYPDTVSTEGISGITEADVAAAASANMKIKLLGRAMRLENGKVCVFVAPHFVPQSCQLSHVDGVFNAILVRANAVGEAMFYGPGAGKLPTGSAVVGDMVDAAWHLNQRRPLDWADAKPELQLDAAELELPYVVRTPASQAQVEAAFGPVQALAGQAYLLSKPMSRKAIEAAGLELLALRPVFQ